MKVLGYFFNGMTYLGSFGFVAVLFLVTGIHVYRVGVIAWFFAGGIGDAYEIFGAALMQPISWGLLGIAGIGFLGKYQIAKRLDRRDLPDPDESN